MEGAIGYQSAAQCPKSCSRRCRTCRGALRSQRRAAIGYLHRVANGEICSPLAGCTPHLSLIGGTGSTRAGRFCRKKYQHLQGSRMDEVPQIKEILASRGIRPEDVFDAADRLLAEGLRPTIERVRQKIGRGSPNTVSPMLERWFASLGAWLAGGALAPGGHAASNDADGGPGGSSH